jgi:hypothetical protein
MVMVCDVGGDDACWRLCVDGDCGDDACWRLCVDGDGGDDSCWQDDVDGNFMEKLREFLLLFSERM